MSEYEPFVMMGMLGILFAVFAHSIRNVALPFWVRIAMGGASVVYFIWQAVTMQSLLPAGLAVAMLYLIGKHECRARRKGGRP